MFVFFASGTIMRDVPVASRLRFMRRYPRRAWWWFLSWCTRELTDSDVAHVSIGVGDIVFDPSLAGDRVWPLTTYLCRYPTLTEFWVVPSRAGPSLPPANRTPRPWFPTLLSHMTGGAVKADNCVSVVAEILRRHGVPVPADIISPDDLRAWFRVKGYRHERIE